MSFSQKRRQDFFENLRFHFLVNEKYLVDSLTFELLISKISSEIKMELSSNSNLFFAQDKVLGVCF